jgi:hypothetical protein
MSIKTLALLLSVIAATCVGAATVHAQPFARTWVSNTGTDTSTQCSVTAPCLTFAHAITETSIGGEINCLTPGGFGAVTISISVTIDCEGASNGGISVSSGAAITINEAGAVVNLIGLDINGENLSAAGISITAAATVTIRNCKIYDFPSTNGGIVFTPGASGGFLMVDSVLIANANYGILESITAGVTNMSVRNSVITNSNQYGILVATNGGTHAGATIEQTTLANNSNGLNASGGGSVAIIGGSTVVNNKVGVGTSGGGIVYSFKNNQIGGNESDGTPLTAYPGGPLN